MAVEAGDGRKRGEVIQSEIGVVTRI